MNTLKISTLLTGNNQNVAKQMITSICCCLFFLNTEAQVTPSTDSSYFDLSLEELQQIKVKSTSFFERDILTVGSSVSVVERNNWERKGVRRTLDAISQEPSIMLLPSVSGMNVIAIRGYAQVGSARGIATLVDGVPMNGPYLGTGQYSVPNVNLGVLNRIEVIRGPGSALYGSDAFHGVLSMTTFESEEDLTRVSAQGGTDHYYQGSLQQSIGLGDHARLDFALGVSGENRNRSYQAQDLNTLIRAEVNPKERYRSQTGSLKLTVTPTPRLKIKGGLLADNYDTYNHPSELYTVNNSDRNSRTLAGHFSATYSFAQNQTLEARSYHMRNHSPRSFTRRFGALGVVDLGVSTKEERTGFTLIFRQPKTKHRRTEYAIAVGHELISHEAVNASLTPLDPPASPVQVDLGDAGSRNVTHLLLDARTALLGDQWSLLYGGRVDNYSDADIQITPRLGIIFQPAENTAIKLLYQHAFRAPNLAEKNSLAAAGPNLNLNPETLDSYELVFAKQRDDWKVEVVLFQNDWNEGILLRVNDPSSPTGAVYENSGRNQSRGIETSFDWHPDSWLINLSSSYVRSSNLKVDEKYQLFPPIMINAGVGRTIENLGLEIYLNNHFFNGAQDIAYNASLLGTPEDLPAYWRTDLNVTKHFASGMDVTINIINLLDRDNRVPSVLGLPGGVEDHSLNISAGIRFTF